MYVVYKLAVVLFMWASLAYSWADYTVSRNKERRPKINSAEKSFVPVPLKFESFENSLNKPVN